MTRRLHDQHITCRCGTPTPNGELTCEACLNQLDTALGELPWLDEQLEVGVTRQRAANYAGAGGHSTGETPLPWSEPASRAARRLQHTLTTWVRRCHAEGVTHQSTSDELPTPADEPGRWTITAMSRWLAWRVDGLAHHEFGHTLMTEVTGAAASATQVVLWTKPRHVFLGPCDMHAICGGEVYAKEGADQGRCAECGSTYPVDQRRDQLNQQLDDRLYTAAGIAHLSTFLGIDVPRERVRQRINLWHHRKRIHPVIRDPHTGEPLFRYGDVRALLSATDQPAIPKTK